MRPLFTSFGSTWYWMIGVKRPLRPATQPSAALPTVAPMQGTFALATVTVPLGVLKSNWPPENAQTVSPGSCGCAFVRSAR